MGVRPAFLPSLVVQVKALAGELPHSPQARLGSIVPALGQGDPSARYFVKLGH